ELLLPPVERLLADAEPATDLGDFFSALDLVQGVDNFLVAASLAWHLRSPLAGLASLLRKSQIASFSRFLCRGFWGLGQDAAAARCVLLHSTSDVVSRVHGLCLCRGTLSDLPPTQLRHGRLRFN